VARLELEPFSNEHLEDAARLLAARHAHHREAEPLLSARFEDPAAAHEELERVWQREAASGAAAIRGGRVVGYLVGAPRPDPAWGDNVWIEAPGHAAESSEDVRDLYGAMAEQWVEAGRTRHSVLVPAWDGELLDTWSRLCFGKQHAHGLRELAGLADVSLPDGFEIRSPDIGEIDELIDIDLALPEHQRRSPVFGSPLPYTREESHAEWVATLAADEEEILVGAYHGRPVACWAVVPAERSSENRGLLIPEHWCFLGFAATLPEFRGSGIGVALTHAAFAWAAENGYPAMTTDWRVTNLLASRFWPKRGFRTSFLRLYRSIP
jgi:ribosomal protein S18 acetylase RimI-like enzyme